MPYKYAVECICDRLAAGRVYNGKNFNYKQPYEYWDKVDKKSPIKIHPGIYEFIEVVLNNIAKDGIDNSLNSKYLQKVYNDISKKYMKADN